MGSVVSECQDSAPVSLNTVWKLAISHSQMTSTCLTLSVCCITALLSDRQTRRLWQTDWQADKQTSVYDRFVRKPTVLCFERDGDRETNVINRILKVLLINKKT